jgi:Zn-dependent protease
VYPGGRQVVGLPREAFRPSPIFLGLTAVCVASGAMLWTGFGNAGLNAFLFVVAGWLVSLCLHEYAHAVTAYRGGDRGVADRGYLRLDPLKYSHPLLSIVLPLLIVVLGGIGLPGGAVWVDRHALRGRGWDSFISFAGPAMNVVFAVALAVPFAIGVDLAARPDFWASWAFLAFLQLTASLLNFLPIPGIDGGNLVEPWLNDQWRRGFGHVAPFGFLLLFGLFQVPLFRDAFFWLVFVLAELLGLPPGLYSLGYSLFQFWN